MSVLDGIDEAELAAYAAELGITLREAVELIRARAEAEGVDE